MNIVQTMRWIVFLALYGSVIAPLYLTLKFNAPEWLFVYVPVLAFWTVLIYAHVEGTPQEKPETPILEVHP